MKARLITGFKYMFFVWGVIPGSVCIVGLIYKYYGARAYPTKDVVLAVLLALPFVIGVALGGSDAKA